MDHSQGGKGFGKIKRAPAYTFGHVTPATFAKPVAKPYAPIFNIRGMGRKGQFKVTHGVVACQFETPGDRGRKPGPAAYAPRTGPRYKRPPAYSCRPPARPPYQAWDQWTPPPNMYLPPMMSKKAPAYTLGYMARDIKPQDLPGPGEHEPNFNYVKRTKPAYTFGHPFKTPKPPTVPPPNRYCVKKNPIPTPSFGIRHSQYMGEQAVYLKSSKLDLVANTD
ncbi:uncharacterized protein isoform X2 [Choristoneura fumiferana]|uniref:uncharacterized protein isoform X2 n=1 Tax=Choristoneura fumiferana TaxID=7141 RepID=UPI003D15448C